MSLKTIAVNLGTAIRSILPSESTDTKTTEPDFPIVSGEPSNRDEPHTGLDRNLTHRSDLAREMEPNHFYGRDRE